MATADKKNTKTIFDSLDLDVGRRIRLHRLFYDFGPGNGKIFLLPIDQGLEHGPSDFFENPESVNPDFQLRIASEGGFSGIVFHYGLAAHYMKPYCGRLPVVVKINGKTNIPDEKAPFSPLTASVDDAVRIGADAVGYTLYVGSSMQAQDITQLREVREDCDCLGMPLIVWGYPRGEYVDRKGGKDGLYAIEYAARVANEMGADVVKLNFPNVSAETQKAQPKPYNALNVTPLQAMQRIVKAAGKTLVILSGGSKASDEDVLTKTRTAIQAGAVGVIFGRNIWQRKYKDALKLAEKIKYIMQRGN